MSAKIPCWKKNFFFLVSFIEPLKEALMHHSLSRWTFVLLLVFLAVTVCLGIALAQIAAQAAIEAQTTPTPLPRMENVMQITPDPNAPTPEPMLRSGMQGEEITRLQLRLQELGYYAGIVDGQFGPGTKEAVILFQQTNHLEADGVVGPATRDLLYSGQAFKYTP